MPEISITSSSYRTLTKKELIAAIERTFPGPDYQDIAIVTTSVSRSKADDSIKIVNQGITFGKQLEV